MHENLISAIHLHIWEKLWVYLDQTCYSAVLNEQAPYISILQSSAL